MMGEVIWGSELHSLFVFCNPFLETNPNCVDVIWFHIVGKVKVDQMNKFHEVYVILRFCKEVAENNWGDKHDPERPHLHYHVRVFLFEVWCPCSKL